ncbi:MAG: UDP-3-O-(3-hydroxymyristoyl)glucosamine N-acyltransferase [Fimbriimonadaceae bacterium]|nr:UDP-3-O-(3-hydroxymyristoyl)glucosamine N-acyltransferase [Fimbriimonadaceae bacterium]
MAQRNPNWTLTTLAERIGGRADGPDIPLSRPVPAGSDDPLGITFAENERYLGRVEESGVGAVLVTDEMMTKKPAIRVAMPRVAFGMLLALHVRPVPLEAGTHPTAIVDPAATIDPSASIGPYAVIGPGAEIRAGARVHAFCYVGQDCEVGEDAVLLPRVTLIQEVTVGARTIIHSGTVIGADGFGYFWDGKKRSKVPQVGGVQIGADVEIGANVCIDRATCGDTVVADGVKLDNLVQVGHNVEIDEHTVIAALTGISGSVRIGKRVMMGGQVAINDHTEVGDDVMLAGRTGIMKSVTEPGEYFGTPATPAKEALRLLVLQRRLPELLDRIKELEARLSKLEP